MKPIDNFPGYYADASGVIFSDKSGKLLPLRSKIQNSGYQIVILSVGGRPHSRLVHRLIAEAFIPNVRGLREVNHIDCEKSHNAASNLEWCNRSANTKHSYDAGLREGQRAAVGAANKRRGVAVVGTSIADGSLLRFDSIRAAREAGFSAVSHCLSGLIEKHKGYRWSIAA